LRFASVLASAIKVARPFASIFISVYLSGLWILQQADIEELTSPLYRLDGVGFGLDNKLFRYYDFAALLARMNVRFVVSGESNGAHVAQYGDIADSTASHALTALIGLDVPAVITFVARETKRALGHVSALDARVGVPAVFAV